ncbi:hypothetical protein HYT02_05855 [Candidatus Gottesmanbacteria bacterium]|nr:hypothetical protein [Candidatus Gottesmanbacteria bacterium]
MKSVVDELAGSLTKYTKPSKLGKPFSEIMRVTKKRVARKLALENLEEDSLKAQQFEKLDKKKIKWVDKI